MDQEVSLDKALTPVLFAFSNHLLPVFKEQRCLVSTKEISSYLRGIKNIINKISFACFEILRKVRKIHNWRQILIGKRAQRFA
ncbi:uncharacterized protein LOC114517416 isoform X2 [Dendronephthya gigantea]|uniref:uncharacterized protein LOC114517416 isoform X2 n=1 Tax=Dendronephthya gigantea TaxID=151771 RepID=UPI00106AF0B0|nr:uncharacterized protein LOC114517416 isoform X2 [Dendronephthya gigantea]